MFSKNHSIAEALRQSAVALAVLVCLGVRGTALADTYDFNDCWRFHLGAASGAGNADFDHGQWERVRLPHTARVEQLVTGATGPESNQWQGVCWYRKEFRIGENLADKVVWLVLDGAMGTSDVWLNGKLLASHSGGYLPVVLDVTDELRSGATNTLAVRLDNHDNPATGPKPLARLDFNFYGGLYRGARLVVKDRLHITDPILADKPASGGVFVTFPEVGEDRATVRVQTHLQNLHDDPQEYAVRTSVIDSDGNVVAGLESYPKQIAPGKDAEVVQHLELESPQLWSPASPYLYTVRTELLSEGDIRDRSEARVGVRSIKITKDGLRLNGKKTFLRGVNRHQEYPYIGYALSDNAQWRDAYKIKQAGFDYVRLSHYPQSPAFLDACDELGLMVMDCVLGWQYYSDREEFKENQYRMLRDLVRRDRNHPCVLLWEASLNESPMTEAFTDTMNAITHEEYPGDGCYTCGWSGAYDVFIQARQHGGCRGVTDRPCVISEYGDWEYYAKNAGLHQDTWADLAPEERSSRQDRTATEQRLLQQALNFQEAHNDNLKTTAMADGLWVMYDYNRGYSDDLETSGCMDVFRLAKPSYNFFRSQRGPTIGDDGSPRGAVVHIANRWTPDSPLSVKVFSNCDEVELQLNGETVARKVPDDDRFSTHLARPPFTFELDRFTPGTLRAEGFIGGEPVAADEAHTPGPPVRFVLSIDESSRPVQSGCNDVVFVHAQVVDEQGVPTEAAGPVTFALEGDGELIGDNPAPCRAGVATILYRAGHEPGDVYFAARAEGVVDGRTTLAVLRRNDQGGEPCEQIHDIARSR